MSVVAAQRMRVAAGFGSFVDRFNSGEAGMFEVQDFVIGSCYIIEIVCVNCFAIFNVVRDVAVDQVCSYPACRFMCVSEVSFACGTIPTSYGVISFVWFRGLILIL